MYFLSAAGAFSIGELVQPCSGPEASKRAPERRLSPDEEVVEKCIQLSKNRRVNVRYPFYIAQKVKGWTRDQWDVAHASYRTTQARQWYTEDELCFS